MSAIVTSRILHVPFNTGVVGLRSRWFWPLPRLDGSAPCILAPTEPLSDTIEIGYQDRSSSPDLVPVLAAQDGIIPYAGTSADGATVCIDHPAGWSTQYSELADLLARPTDRFRQRRKERVRAGDVIGHARRSALRIRFALTQLTEDGCVAVDPAASMPAWSMLPWFTEHAQRLATDAAS
jgi:Peptidase family M23